MPWATRYKKPIPSVGTRQTGIELNDYSGGMDNFVSNDKFPVKDGGANKWRLAQNGRIPSLGEYETRKGFDFHSDAVGETMDDSQTAVTGAADQSFSQTARLAQPFVPVQSGKLTKIEVRLKNASSATGTIMVEIWSDASTAPGTRLARSSVAASSPTSSYAYAVARFANPVTITGGTSYWIVVYTQATGSGTYNWSSTTANSGAKSSSDSGTSWSSLGAALNFKQYYATNAAPKGLFRAYKSDGTKVTLLAHGTTLYSVNNVTGALTAIKTGLNASATHYRFVLINDIVYYCNSYDGLRKWDFTTESQVNTTNYATLCHHKGLLFGARVDEPTRIDYSNFGEYEVFTSTDFVYAIGPKTGDPVTALVSLNGYLVIFTRNNKIILSGDDNATFTDDEAPDQKGTYTQETVTQDANFMYYLAEDGVYRSNGSEAQLLSESVYQSILALANKDDCIMVINKARLYLWYRSGGTAYNDSCYVWNLNFGSGSADCVESHDTDALVCRAVNAFQDDDELLVASSLVGQVYWQELASNDYTNLGDDIDFELKTHYFTFGTPAAKKSIRKWIARFGAQDGNYTISSEYAYDLRDNWQAQSTPDVQGTGTTWGSGALWGSFTWGATAEVQDSQYVPGEYRRIALRYKHYAARQPNKFLGHTMQIQTRRIR